MKTMIRETEGGKDPRTYEILGAAMEVHREIGPGRLEAVYQEALEIEFAMRKIPFRSQPQVTLAYKGRPLKKFYIPDFLVYGEVIVEIKSQSHLTDIDQAQVINLLKCAGRTVGLLINFGEASLQWRRFVQSLEGSSKSAKSVVPGIWLGESSAK